MGLHESGIGARYFGFGEADRGMDLTGDQRRQPSLPQTRVGKVPEHQGILERCRAEDTLPPVGPADRFVEAGIGQERQAAAADVSRMAERPEAFCLGLSLQVAQELRPVPALVEPIQLGFGGQDPLVHEGAELTPELGLVRTDRVDHRAAQS